MPGAVALPALPAKTVLADKASDEIGLKRVSELRGYLRGLAEHCGGKAAGKIAARTLIVRLPNDLSMLLSAFQVCRSLPRLEHFKVQVLNEQLWCASAGCLLLRG